MVNIWILSDPKDTYGQEKGVITQNYIFMCTLEELFRKQSKHPYLMNLDVETVWNHLPKIVFYLDDECNIDMRLGKMAYLFQMHQVREIIQV